MHTYDEFEKYLGNKINRPLANNTRVYRDNEKIVISLHNNPILTHYPNGDVAYNSCGWMTHTTKERFNDYGAEGWGVYQEKGQWHLAQHGRFNERYVFQDGVIVNGDSIWNEGHDRTTEIKDMTKRIKKYASDYVTELLNGKIEPSSSGDCWLCLGMFDSGDTEHLISHMKESYYIPTLLLNAMKETPICQITSDGIGRLMCGMEVSDWQKRIVKEDVYKALYNYMKKHILKVAL